MQKLLTALLVAALATANGAPAFQAGDPELESGIQQAQEGDFDAAIVTLDRAVRRLASQKNSGQDLGRAYVYLSIAYLGLGQQQAAKARFLEALSANPQLELSPTEFAPRILGFFNDVKKEAAQAQLAAAKPPESSRPPATAPQVAASPPPKKKSKTGIWLVVGGGLAAAGVGLAAAGGGGSAGSTVPVGATSSTQPVQTNPPTTQPAPPTVPGQNQPPSAVFRVSPNPPRGQAPLNVSFSMCDSQDPEGDRLQFSYDFGDGERDADPGTPCQRAKTYPAGGTFNATICVSDGQAGHDRCQVFPVEVAGPTPPPTSTTTTTTTTTSTVPTSRTLTLRTEGNFPGTATSDPPGINCSFPPAQTCVATFPNGIGVRLTGSVTPPGSATFSGDCTGVTTCAVLMGSDKFVTVTFSGSSLQSGTDERRGAIRWTSRLDLPGTKGQVVLNGRELAFVDSAIAGGSVEAEGGRVRIEAQLVAADGQPGTWRFELSGPSRGTFRVIAGQAAVVTSDAITFSLRGRSGERVVFDFVQE